VPKLWIHGDPGAVETANVRSFCSTWPNQKEITVKGMHFIQEDSPTEIREATLLNQFLGPAIGYPCHTYSRASGRVCCFTVRSVCPALRANTN
jgi:hypothetical protein